MDKPVEICSRAVRTKMADWWHPDGSPLKPEELKGDLKLCNDDYEAFYRKDLQVHDCVVIMDGDTEVYRGYIYSWEVFSDNIMYVDEESGFKCTFKDEFGDTYIDYIPPESN